MNRIAPASLRSVLLALFTVSGFSGLIYESIWSHYLKLLLGHAAYAQTLVLAIFMGGMAVGAWLASRYSDRWTRPLIAYAVVEGIVGLFAVAFHPVFVRVLEVLHSSVLPTVGSSGTIVLVKWVVGACLILPQSILLGTTFPLMSAAVIRICPRSPGETLALLYFTNSIGAASGVLASGFVLIPWSGLPGTVLIGGILNLLLAITVGWVARTGGPTTFGEAAAESRSDEGAVPFLLLAAALLTGAASFFYEIGWIRMLSLVLGTTNQAFELMLSAFIAGLAIGGLWIRRRVDRLESPLRFAGRVQILMGVFALLTLPLYGVTFDLMGWMIRGLGKTDGGYLAFHVGSQAIALAVMLPATVMAGMTLPLFTFALLRRGLGEKAIGRVYAANTIGAILGVAAAVHVVMPAVGTRGLVISGATIDLALGVGLLTLAWRRLVRWELPASVGVATLVLVLVLVGVRFDPHRTASGVYRHGVARLPPGTEVLFHRDGKTATIGLVRSAEGFLKITTNGKPDAEIAMRGGGPASDEVTMVMVAALPLALHPQARTAANIGMGSGMTTHGLLGVDTLRRVDTIEIEAVVLEAARQFGPFVERAYIDPRSHLRVEDAKTFFSSRRSLYDIIVSEPSNPWVSGVASLFTEEFYRHVRGHLNPGGLLVQWLQLYETNLDLMASVFKALTTQFDDYAVFSTDNANVLIVATIDGNLDRLDPWVFTQDGLGRDLARVGIRGLQDLEIRRIGDRAVLQPVFDSFPAPANSDFYPYLAHGSPKARFLGQGAVDLTRLHVAPVPVLEMLDPAIRRGMRPVTSAPDFTPTRAREMAIAIVERAVADAEPDAGAFPALSVATGHCDAQPVDERTLIDETIVFAASTNPFVRGEELNRVWARLSATPCRERISPHVHTWLRLHESVARRDGPEMARIAGELLEAPPYPPTRRESEYLLAAGLTGALSSGDGAAANRFRATFTETYPADATPPFYLQLLLRVAERSTARVTPPR